MPLLPQGAHVLQTLGTHLCTKLVVPSMGSMIHVGLSVSTHFSPAATDSSPMKLKARAALHTTAIELQAIELQAPRFLS